MKWQFSKQHPRLRSWEPNKDDVLQIACQSKAFCHRIKPHDVEFHIQVQCLLIAWSIYTNTYLLWLNKWNHQFSIIRVLYILYSLAANPNSWDPTCRYHHAIAILHGDPRIGKSKWVVRLELEPKYWLIICCTSTCTRIHQLTWITFLIFLGKKKWTSLLERRQWKRQCTSLLALHFANYIQHTRSVFRKKPMKAVWQ